MIIDVNVSLSRWPLRRLPCDETPRLVAKLKQHGVTQAWAGSFDGLLHRDIAGVNARLADECRRYGEGILVPFGSINPMLPDWTEDVRRCREVHQMPGIRLHPNYHGYELKDPAFGEVLALAEKCGLIVQLVVRMDDVRVQHPLMRVPDVDLKPLPDLLASWPKLRIVILNGLGSLRGAELKRVAAARNVFLDIAALEGVGGIAGLVQDVSLNQVVFGSHFPLFSLESAVLKMRESELTAVQTAAISHGNAQRMLSTLVTSGSL
jgi:predicted TIM-barrel fold metal-dependent hydrolase